MTKPQSINKQNRQNLLGQDTAIS